MLILRAVVLALLVCLHVVGGAVLFRRFFPRESPWWGFFLPALALISALNFIEHVVALPLMVVALPFSTVGLILVLIYSRGLWKGLRLPAILFTCSFLFCLWIKCLLPDINYFNTEGLTDLNRILDFCLGDTVPPQDCWLPPYPHTGYYTFMHYGASVLKRLFFVDVGTAYNVSSALVSSLVLLAGGAAAYTLSRFRPIVAVLVLVVIAGGFTGSTPIHIILHPDTLDPAGSIDIGSGTYSRYHEFQPLLRIKSPYCAYRIYTPGCYIYYSEFHANMAGSLVALLTVFSVAEVLRRRRALFPWIWLAVAPVMAFISCPWFVFMVALLAGPSFLLAWRLKRRPHDWRFVFFGAGIWLALLWPIVSSLIQNSTGQPFHPTRTYLRDLITISIQWWPVYLPWLALYFRWTKLDLTARWLHFLLVPIALSVELFYFTDRGTTLEKTLGGAFGIGMAALYPVLFIQRGRFYRGLSALVIASGVLSMGVWADSCYEEAGQGNDSLYLAGDHFLENDPSEKKMEQELRRIRGKTVLTGRARHAWFKSPTVVAFTENRCYLGWTNAEETAGHPIEANRRERKINAFYDEKLPDPLGFLQSANISAVLVWPEDKISDAWIERMKTKLAPEFTYVDCRTESPINAGIFLKHSGVTSR